MRYIKKALASALKDLMTRVPYAKISVSDICELCCPVLVERMKKIFKTSDVTDFQVSFFVDGIICALKRWLISSKCMAPEEFMSQIQSCIRMTAIHIYGNLEEYTVKKEH